MKRQRIVFLTASSDTYGAENALLDLARGIQKEFEPIVVAPRQGPLIDFLSASGIQTKVMLLPVLDRRYFHPARIFEYLASAVVSTFRLLRFFRDLEPALVHTNNVLILPGAFAAKALGIPHVWHVREIIEGHHIRPFLWRIWRGIVTSFSTRVICISSAVRKQFLESGKVVVIHDGIDVTLFSPVKETKSGSRHAHKDVMIGIVGRLDHRRKGQDIFIEAASIALGSVRSLKFVIVGDERDGIEEKERVIHERAKETGLEGKIEFRGFVPRESVPRLMNELDVLVLCSKQPEGFGIVLLEAMACGKAVVSFAEGGPLDIVVDHANGLLVPRGDVHRLANAMLELAGDPVLRAELGSEACKTVRNSFRSDLTSKKIQDLYRMIA